MRAMPYFMKNSKWFTKDEKGNYHLTDKAPKKARKSYVAYFGSKDPKKRHPHYFLSNPKWFRINQKVFDGEGAEQAFELTSKAPPAAVYSYYSYYMHNHWENYYFLRKKSWYTTDETGKWVLTDKAPFLAQASYEEYKNGFMIICT